MKTKITKEKSKSQEEYFQENSLLQEDCAVALGSIAEDGEVNAEYGINNSEDSCKNVDCGGERASGSGHNNQGYGDNSHDSGENSIDCGKINDDGCENTEPASEPARCNVLPLKENKMGTKSIGKLLVSMAVPMMVSMLVMALYNIVDSIFVAKVSEQALSALSLAFPVQSLIIAVSVGIGVGANTSISKNLGKKDYDLANRCVGNSFTLAFLSMLPFLLFGIFGTKWFFSTQTKDAAVIEYGVQYLSLICICSFTAFGQVIFEKILVSTGKTMLTMLMQLFGAAVNIVLDPIFIFGYWGSPKMGVFGASLATVIGQLCAFLLAILLNFIYNKEIKIKLKNFILSKKASISILAIGIPSMAMSAVVSVMAFGLNLILIKISLTAVALMGIFIKLQSFILMPTFGICNSVVPIVSYNYGAEKYDRINKTLYFGIALASIVGCLGFVIVEAIPQYVLKLFNASDDMMGMGVVALRIIGLSYLFPCFTIICSSYFQALGKGVSSLVITLMRQLIILLPVVYLLTLTGNINHVWWAMPIAELCGFIMSGAMLVPCQKKMNTLRNFKLSK